jgi:vacuolar-type H+-ATPase subunit I/STV1
MIGFSRLFFPSTVAGVIAGVIALVLTIYIVIRLGATTSFDQELLDAQTAVSDKETVLRIKQDEVDSAQAQIAPMQATKANAETAEKDANVAYEAAVKHRVKKGKIRNKFVNQDKTVPAAQLNVDRVKIDYSNTQNQIDSLRKALKFTGSKDDLLPVTEAALDELVKFDAKHPTPLTPRQQDQRDLLERRHESLKKLDTLLDQLITLGSAVKAAEKNLTKVTKARDKKHEVADHVAALDAEQKASDERDKKVKANSKATDALNDHVERVGELKTARDTLTAERDELQSTADTIESELGSKTRSFLLKIGVAALLAMFLIAGFAR